MLGGRWMLGRDLRCFAPSLGRPVARPSRAMETGGRNNSGVLALARLDVPPREGGRAIGGPVASGTCAGAGSKETWGGVGGETCGEADGEAERCTRDEWATLAATGRLKANGEPLAWASEPNAEIKPGASDASRDASRDIG